MKLLEVEGARAPELRSWRRHCTERWSCDGSCLSERSQSDFNFNTSFRYTGICTHLQRIECDSSVPIL